MTGPRRLTKIEKLDYDYPGLADQMRQWFLQGVPVRNIPRLVLEKYKLRISETPVARFRRRRWVRELDMAQEKRIEALIAQQLAREREIRSAMDTILGDLK